MREAVYLKQNVLAEPLVNQWYAWSYLIAPATAAMYIANLQLKVMQSFVAAPQIHVAALKNPAMMGGPFINYAAGRARDVRGLMERTAKEQAHMVKFAEGVKTLNHTLASGAGGYSLEQLYREVPDILRGYVELVYDLNDHPSVRFIEGLLYRSPFYDVSTQSMALSLVENDSRPFVFSTPRFPGDGVLHLSIPFGHRGLDELFKMESEPQPLDAVRALLGVKEEEAELFSTFFTGERPPQSPGFAGPGVRVRYFGHACVLVESEAVNVLCDPVISYRLDEGIDRYTFADLPERIDYVLITHNHQDHCMFETLLRLRHKIGTVLVPKNSGGALADPSLKMVLQHLGFRRVQEIDEMETVEIDGGSITGLPFFGEHADLNVRTKLAYFIKLKGRSVLCVADSNNLEPRLYEHVRELVEGLDVLFIGMECDGGPMSWLFGPLFTRPIAGAMDRSRRLDGSDFDKGINMVDQLGPAHVYVYAMGQEPWLTYLTSIRYTETSRPIVESDRLVAECRRRGIVAERLFGRYEMFLEPR